MTLSTRRGLLCGSFGMLILAGCAADQPPPPAAAAPPPPPTGVAEVGVVEVIATVESVDRTAREVLLRGPQGGLLTVRVGRQVRNFDRLRAGQRLVRAGNAADFIEASVIDARLRELDAQRRELAAEMRGDGKGNPLQ